MDTGYHVTTPEAPEVQKYLARMRTAGLTHVVLEATSHGLAQYRVAACEFDIAVVTNITHEHLDYHGSYEAYRKAKMRLFESLAITQTKAHGNPRLAILNRDDSSYPFLSSMPLERTISYGMEPSVADVRAEEICYDPDGLHFKAVGSGFQFPVHSHLLGAHNVANCLAAISVAINGLGLSPEAVQHGIEEIRVPGRMEQINLGQDFLAIVDFAHTPNALRNVLRTARQLTQGRVITIIGSAGLRDREKRKMMPEAAVELADVVILTAEDPRTESLADILMEMATAGRKKGGVDGKNLFITPDRGKAISQALAMAKSGDVVIVCGKGHEQSMCFGEIEYPWDDRVAMHAALARLLGVEGPSIPYLPTQS